MAGGDSTKVPCCRCGEDKKYRRHVPLRVDGFVVYRILCQKCIQLQLSENK
jgi:hypothetical protein